MRELIIQFLIQRDGYRCRGCDQPFREKEPRITIHHIDGEPNHNDPSNLCLMHDDCNTREYRKLWKEAVKSHLGVVLERERAKRTPMLIPVDSDGFAPNKNYVVEPKFRSWVFSYLKNAFRDVRHIKRKELVRNGAAYVGSSQQSCYGYLGKMLADFYGMLEVRPDPSGEPCVYFRFREDYDLTVDDLHGKYPWEGMRVKEREERVEEVKSKGLDAVLMEERDRETEEANKK